MENTYYKYCIVPQCTNTNTTVKTANTIFIRLPEGKNRRIKWLKACKRNVGDISEKNSALFVCEDHFNLEEDMENYVPHIFDYQPDKKRTFSNPPRAAAVKRTKRRIIDDAIASTCTITKESDLSSNNSKGSPQPLTDMDLETDDTTGDTPLQKSFLSQRDVSVQAHPVTVRDKAVQCELHFGAMVSLSPIKLSEWVEVT